MDKNALLDRLLETLTLDLQSMTQAANAAHAAATHEESRAEDSHDTRGLEASYLAGAQAKRAMELERQIAVVRAIPRDALPEGARIRVGSGVELETQGRASYYFLIGMGGGLSLNQGATKVNFISPQSPIGQELMERRASERFTVETEQGSREYRIVRVF